MRKPRSGSEALRICLGGAFERGLGLSDYVRFNFSRSLRSKIGRWPAMCSQHPNSSHLQPSHARQAACGAAICRPRELLMRKTVFSVHPLLRSDRTWGWPCIMVRGSSSSAWCPTSAPRASIYICAPRAQRRESPPFRAGFPRQPI